MFHKLLTNVQLSLLLQIAALINVIGLFSDLIIYHYFTHADLLICISENLNNLSIFMMCTILISQALIIFYKHHVKLFSQFPGIAITLATFITIFLLWLLMVENDIEGKFIIFYSAISQADHSYKSTIILTILTILLIIDFYTNLNDPIYLSNKTIFASIRSSFFMVLRKHLALIIFVYGLIHFKRIHTFSVAALNYSKESLLYDFSLLEFIIPTTWIGLICYYIYHKITTFYGKKDRND